MSTEDQFVTKKAVRPAMEKHIQFWDRKNKGYITPVDTVFGFIHLGYGIVISVTLGTFLGMLLSYSTQDSWMPDPMCRTRVEKWRRKDAAYQMYDKDGQLDVDRFDELFEKHAKSDIGGQSITIKELLEWNEASYKNPLAWSSTALEWLAIYLLVGSKGVVTKQDIQAAYDGTLFYQVRDRKKASRSIQSLGDSSLSSPLSSTSPLSSINIYGVKVPGSYIQQLETRLNQVMQTIPHPTFSVLETRLKHWPSFAQRQQTGSSASAIDNNDAMHPILKGVATPSPIRRSLFSGASPPGSDESLYIEEKDHQKDELTGVMAAVDETDSSMTLSGVQGYVPSTSTDEIRTGNKDDLTGGAHSSGTRAELSSQHILSAIHDHSDTNSYSNGHEYNNGWSFSMAGVRSEETKDPAPWPYSLTGVSPSPSAASNLADQQNNDSTITNDDGSASTSSNDDDRERAAFDEQSISPGDGDGDSTQLAETPPLTDNGSVNSDMDDMIDNSPAKDGRKDSTTQSDTQPISTTSTHHTYTITIPQNGTSGNSEPSSGSKSSKKSKKNKKKKNRQQQAPTPPAKDHGADDYISQQQSQSLSCKNIATPPFTGSLSFQEDGDDD